MIHDMRTTPAGARLLSGPARVALATLAFAALGPGPSRADAPGECPSSIVFVDRYASASPFSTDAVAYDSTFTSVANARITFDRTDGRLTWWATQGGRLQGYVRVVEHFDLAGVAPGTPVDATLELRLDGWSEQNCGGSGCGVEFEGWLVAGGDSVSANANQAGPGMGIRTIATTLSLPIHFVAGSPVEAQFLWRYGTGPGGGAHAEGTGVYRLTGLPAGVTAFACPDAGATPTRRASWGQIRSLYR